MEGMGSQIRFVSQMQFCCNVWIFQLRNSISHNTVMNDCCPIMSLGKSKGTCGEKIWAERITFNQPLQIKKSVHSSSDLTPHLTEREREAKREIGTALLQPNGNQGRVSRERVHGGNQNSMRRKENQRSSPWCPLCKLCKGWWVAGLICHNACTVGHCARSRSLLFQRFYPMSSGLCCDYLTLGTGSVQEWWMKPAQGEPAASPECICRLPHSNRHLFVFHSAS